MIEQTKHIRITEEILKILGFINNGRILYGIKGYTKIIGGINSKKFIIIIDGITAKVVDGGDMKIIEDILNINRIGDLEDLCIKHTESILVTKNMERQLSYHYDPRDRQDNQ